jgi:glucosamine-phosphate N-acetyltransferase
MDKKIIFRRVEEKDLSQVFPLLQQLTEIDYSNRDEKDCWNKFNSNTSSNSIVGLYEGEVIAYGSLVVENKIRGEAAGHIEDIVVNNTVRGKNIGLCLIRELIKIAKEKGCYRVTLFCKESLVKFYNKTEFKISGSAMKVHLDLL